MNDRRSHPRFEGHFKAELLNLGDDPCFSLEEAIVQAEALDVSKGGLRLQTSYNVAVGSMVSVIAYYEGRCSIGLCDVVWKRENNDVRTYGLFIKKWSQLDALLARKLDEMEQQDAQLPQESQAISNIKALPAFSS